MIKISYKNAINSAYNKTHSKLYNHFSFPKMLFEKL